MTNFITSVGSQQFSITIASGSTTGTATINAVGSGAFIEYGGVNPSVTNNPSEDYAGLTLTNSTTITATRNTGTAGTIVVKGCVIDGDTTNLIKSIQYGTVSVASSAASGTASISAVTNANTAIHYLGHSDAIASFSNVYPEFRVSLSGTTVTATRGTSSLGLAAAIYFIAIEFQGSALNQAVQNVSASNSASSATWTAALTSVNVNNAISFYGGQTSAANISGSLAVALLSGQLTSSTVFTINLNTATNNVKVFNASIVELAAGVLNSAVQRGTTTLTGVTSNTSSITAVTAANSGISYLGNTATATTVVLDQALGAVALTNGTTVTTTKKTATSNITASWEVYEFPAFSGGTATTYRFSGASSGTVGVASGTISVTPTGGNWPNAVSIALTDGSSGSFATSPLTPTGGTSTPATFTYTPGAVGAISLTPNSSGAMTDPSPWVYTSNSAGQIFMQWLPRYGG